MTYYKSIQIRASALQPNDVIVVDKTLPTSENFVVNSVTRFSNVFPKKVLVGSSNTNSLMPWDRRLDVRRPVNGPAMTPTPPRATTTPERPEEGFPAHSRTMQKQLKTAREEYLQKIKEIISRHLTSS